MTRKQWIEATVGCKVPENDGRRHALTLTVSDYKRRRGLLWRLTLLSFFSVVPTWSLKLSELHIFFCWYNRVGDLPKPDQLFFSFYFMYYILLWRLLWERLNLWLSWSVYLLFLLFLNYFCWVYLFLEPSPLTIISSPFCWSMGLQNYPTRFLLLSSQSHTEMVTVLLYMLYKISTCGVDYFEYEIAFTNLWCSWVMYYFFVTFLFCFFLPFFNWNGPIFFFYFPFFPPLSLQNVAKVQ